MLPNDVSWDRHLKALSHDLHNCIDRGFLTGPAKLGVRYGQLGLPGHEDAVELWRKL